MKRLLLIVLMSGAFVRADQPANPLSLADGKVVLDVQDRLRLQVQENIFDFNNKIDSSTDDTFLLQRFRLGLTVKPSDWIKTYVQGQDTRAIDTKTDNVPFVLGSEGDDSFDLRQAYAEVGNLTEFPVSLKVGRQELAYGDERLVGASDWNNFSRTFDAVKLHYQNTEQKFWVDGFAGHVVTIQGHGPNSNYGFDFNDADWNDTFAGIYAGTSRLTFQTTEAYFLYRNKTDSDPLYSNDNGNTVRGYDIKQEIYTVGLRLKSTPGQLHGFDYELEGAYQWGRDGGRLTNSFPNAGGIMLPHYAWALESRAGYTWTNCPWTPRLGVEFDVSTGDKSQFDHTDQSFLNLFPTNHKFYGYMDLFAWKNVYDPSVNLKVTPYQDKKYAWRSLWAQVDFHSFWLYTNEDAWYRANAVTTVRPVNVAATSAGTYCGSEIDLTVGFAPIKWGKVLAGYSHFWAGTYLRDTQTATAGADGADFGYVQTTLSF